MRLIDNSRVSRGFRFSEGMVEQENRECCQYHRGLHSITKKKSVRQLYREGITGLPTFHVPNSSRCRKLKERRGRHCGEQERPGLNKCGIKNISGGEYPEEGE